MNVIRTYVRRLHYSLCRACWSSIVQKENIGRCCFFLCLAIKRTTLKCFLAPVTGTGASLCKVSCSLCPFNPFFRHFLFSLLINQVLVVMKTRRHVQRSIFLSFLAPNTSLATLGELQACFVQFCFCTTMQLYGQPIDFMGCCYAIFLKGAYDSSNLSLEDSQIHLYLTCVFCWQLKLYNWVKKKNRVLSPKNSYKIPNENFSILRPLEEYLITALLHSSVFQNVV